MFPKCFENLSSKAAYVQIFIFISSISTHSPREVAIVFYPRGAYISLAEKVIALYCCKADSFEFIKYFGIFEADGCNIDARYFLLLLLLLLIHIA